MPRRRIASRRRTLRAARTPRCSASTTPPSSTELLTNPLPVDRCRSASTTVSCRPADVGDHRDRCRRPWPASGPGRRARTDWASGTDRCRRRAGAPGPRRSRRRSTRARGCGQPSRPGRRPGRRNPIRARRDVAGIVSRNRAALRARSMPFCSTSRVTIATMGVVSVRPACLGGQRGPAVGPAGQVIRGVRAGDPVVGGRIPDGRVDTVADPDQPVAEGRQSVVEAHAQVLGEDLAGVAGTDGDHPVHQLECSRHRIGRPPRSESERFGTQPFQPVLAGDSLVTEGVDGEHHRDPAAAGTRRPQRCASR